MNIKATIKARNAAAKLSKGETDEAMKLYREAIDEGLSDPRMLLSYSVLLVRRGEFQEAREWLVKWQNLPMGAEQKQQLYVNYAVCVYKLGEREKALELLERQSARNESGLIYETLGYLYVDAGEKDKALAFNQKALEYDEDDAIVQDNLGQTYYRLFGDKEKAKPYFDKALELRPSQIDTLYFLSRYDLDRGDKEAAKEKLERALPGRYSPHNHVTKDMIEKELAQLG